MSYNFLPSVHSNYNGGGQDTPKNKYKKHEGVHASNKLVC